MQKKVLIVGNGIAGITCARHIRKQSDFHITVISSESKYFYSRTALMYIYMGHMKQEHTKPYEDFFWEKNRINLLYAHVTNIQPEAKKITLDNGQSHDFDFLVLATGSTSNKFGWPGQDLKAVQGLYNLQDLQTMEEHTAGIAHAVVIGGGLIGIETVEMLLTRNISVSFLIREKSFWDIVLPPEESQLINKIIRHHGVDLQLETELGSIKDDGNGRANAIVTKNGKEISCGFVALTVGVSPNIQVAKNIGIETGKGILVNEYFQTNYPYIFAVGDCAEFREPLPGRKPVEQVWYTGKLHGETAAANITGNRKPYRPGHWFNSAKFFNLEYQTYGLVPASLNNADEWFWWQDKKSERGLRLMWDKKTNVFKALNAFGIRIRHEVCNEWLNNNTTIQEVVSQLRKANFDPEFYKNYEKEFTHAFKQQAILQHS